METVEEKYSKEFSTLGSPGLESEHKCITASSSSRPSRLLSIIPVFIMIILNFITHCLAETDFHKKSSLTKSSQPPPVVQKSTLFTALRMSLRGKVTAIMWITPFSCTCYTLTVKYC